MFQCLIGCRVSDLNRLTKANIVDGFVEYIPQKTKMEHANTVRVPLNQKARDILERYKDLESALLPRFSHFGYNKKIKEILKYVGIDRTVIVLDPKTREDVARPLYEVATYPYGTQDLHRQPLQAGQGPEPDSLHVGTFGRKPGLRTVPQD